MDAISEMRVKILASGKMLTSGDLTRRGITANHLVANNCLIQLQRPDGNYAYPAFQFGSNGMLKPLVARVNVLLRANGKPWGITAWWVGLSPHSSDPSPVTLLDTPLEKTIWDRAITASA